MAPRGKKAGYTMFQCKIGSDPDENERCVRACREVLDDTDILAVDPNAGTITTYTCYNELSNTGAITV